MKNLFYFILFLCLVVGCSKDEVSLMDYFEPLSQDTLIFTMQGNVQTLVLKTNLEVEVVNEIKDWCRVELAHNAVIFVTGVNPDAESRFGYVWLKTSLGDQSVYVRQQGSAPAVDLIQSSFVVSADTNVLSVPVVSNAQFQVNNTNTWVYYLGQVDGENCDTLKFGISPSKWPVRKAVVSLSYGSELEREFMITQKASDTLYQPADMNKVVQKIQVERAESSVPAFQGQEIEHSFDGDFTKWGWFCTNDRVAPKDLPVKLTYYFKDVERIDYLIYYPYSYSGKFAKFDLYVMAEGDSDFKKYGEYDFKGVDTKSRLVFESGLKKPKAIQFRVKSGSAALDNGETYVNCLEMEFYADYTGPSAIFTDETYSALKEGVAYEQIMAIENEFYRNIAMYLYAGIYETEFRVQEYPAYYNTDLQNKEHKALPWGMLDNQTGIYVQDGEEIIVFTGDLHGEQIGIYVVDWEQDYTVIPLLKKIDIIPGINRLVMPNKGLLYIAYHVDEDPATRQPVKIHIASGKVNGYFDCSRHTNADWKRLLANAGHRFFDVKGKYVNLAFETSAFRQYCPEEGLSLTQVYDSIGAMEHRLSGLFKYNRMIPNRLLCHVHYGKLYFYATQYRTAYIDWEQKLVCNPEALKLDSWGVAHELGHVHQNWDINWSGMGEVTNNIFSLQVQTSFGVKSRLLQEGYYQSAQDTLVARKQPFSVVNAVFEQVVQFWQLQLYFTKVLNQPDFYADIHEAMRNEESLSTDGLKQLNFAFLACKMGKKDLSDFFTYWGFFREVPVSGMGEFYLTREQIDQTRRDIAALGYSKPSLAIQYLTDENVGLFRQNKPVVTGKATRNGNLVSMSGWKNVVAYQVYKGGELVQISLSDQFNLRDGSGEIVVKAIAADGTSTPVSF